MLRGNISISNNDWTFFNLLFKNSSVSEWVRYIYLLRNDRSLHRYLPSLMMYLPIVQKILRGIQMKLFHQNSWLVMRVLLKRGSSRHGIVEIGNPPVTVAQLCIKTVCYILFFHVITHPTALIHLHMHSYHVISKR